MGLGLNIQILSATDVGGVYPFVVVCFDGDVTNELYKTDATTGGPSCTWNHQHVLDLTTNIKAMVADGRPEPTYLTFFLFDTGTPGVPALGSAGVLLETVREHGKAQGDFPIVNGTGSLRLVVNAERSTSTRLGITEEDGGLSTGAKVAAGAGVTALAAGLTGLALHHRKKKKAAREEEEEKKNSEGREEGEGERGRAWWDDSDEEKGEE